MNILIDSFLKNRGYSEKYFDDKFSCDHRIPKDIDVLCERLDDYRRSQRHLIILSDVDVDGIMSGIIAFAGFSELGFRVSLFLPDTSHYGFDAGDIIRLKSEYPDAEGIITGDVGITAFDGIKKAKELGLEVFVTDHHKYLKPTGADIEINPQRPDDVGSYSLICGANVMYQVVRYYAEYFAENKTMAVNRIDRLRVFAGIGTVSDAMPLFHENRPLVKDAISICRLIYSQIIVDMEDGSDLSNAQFLNLFDGVYAYSSAFNGLGVLLRHFIEIGKIKRESDINAEFFGFYLAPAFNSIKRLGASVSLAYLTFFGTFDQSQNAVEAILKLTEQRKCLVDKSFKACNTVLQPYEPYIYLTDAPGGIRGLLAQKLLNQSGLPALVLAKNEDGTFSGSGRCPMWFPFIDRVHSQSWVAGGHNPAFGITVKSIDGLDELYHVIDDLVDELAPSEEDMVFKPDYTVSAFGDGDSGFCASVMGEFLHALKFLEPFGSCFPSPVGLFKINSDDCTFTRLGTNKNHLRITTPENIQILCFNQGDVFNIPENCDDESSCIKDQLTREVLIVGKICYNFFRDVVTVQVQGDIDSDCIIPLDDRQVEYDDYYGGGDDC